MDFSPAYKLRRLGQILFGCVLAAMLAHSINAGAYELAEGLKAPTQELAELRLRLVDAHTSQPLAGMRVELISPVDWALNLMDFRRGLSAETDAQGVAVWRGLIMSPYRLRFAELEQMYDRDRVQLSVARSFAHDFWIDPMQREFLGTQPRCDFYYQLPSPWIPLTTTETLITLALRHTPTVRLKLQDPEGGPLAGMPFELAYEDYVLKGSTDPQGLAEMPTPLFKGGAVSIHVPWRQTASPNQVQFNGSVDPGPPIELALRYIPAPADLALRLDFVDATTGAPVTGAEGWIGEGNWRQPHKFHTSGSSAYIPYFRPSQELLAFEARMQGATADEAETADAWADAQRYNIKLETAAPGYAAEAFVFPLSEFRANPQMTLALEPEASIIGRLMLAPGIPITTDSLRAAFARQGLKDDWLEEVVRAFLPGGPRPANVFGPHLLGLALSNPTLSEKADKRFATQFILDLAPNGSFQLRGIHPDENWVLSLESYRFPLIRRKTPLLPGENDLGEIYLDQPRGKLELQILDEESHPREGVEARFPLDSGPGGSSDVEGRMTVRLDQATRPSDQIIMLRPKVGLGPDNTSISLITWSRIMELPKHEETRASVTLHKGHMLTVQYIPNPSSERLAAAMLSSEQDKKRLEIYESRGAYAGFHGFEIQQIMSSADAWQYCQVFAHEAGPHLTRGPQTIKIPNVPPGKFTLIVKAGLILLPDPPDSISMDYPLGFPIACLEFEMPDWDHTISLELETAEIELALPLDIPRDRQSIKKLSGLQWKLERDQPLVLDDFSVSMGGYNREDRPANEFRRPSFSLSGWMAEFRPSGPPQLLPPKRLHVPLGKYYLRVYRTNQALGKPNILLAEQPVEVRAGGPVLRLPIPLPTSIPD